LQTGDLPNLRKKLN